MKKANHIFAFAFMICFSFPIWAFSASLEQQTNRFLNFSRGRQLYEEAIYDIQQEQWTQAEDKIKTLTGYEGWGLASYCLSLSQRTQASTAFTQQAELSWQQGLQGETWKHSAQANQIQPNALSQHLYAVSSIPDMRFLQSATRADYTYTIIWDKTTIHHLLPDEWVEVTPIAAGRDRMETIIQSFASLYPPDYFNQAVQEICCYRSFRAVDVDENGIAKRDARGNLVWEDMYGAMADRRIIITDRFKNDEGILRALVHEMTHWELRYGVSRERREALYAQLAVVNPPDFEYEMQEASESYPDSFVSTESAAHYKQGFARSYGMLCAEEDVTTLTEKLVLHGAERYANYPALYAKLQIVAAFRAELHPSFTDAFFDERK